MKRLAPAFFLCLTLTLAGCIDAGGDPWTFDQTEAKLYTIASQVEAGGNPESAARIRSAAAKAREVIGDNGTLEADDAIEFVSRNVNPETAQVISLGRDALENDGKIDIGELGTIVQSQATNPLINASTGGVGGTALLLIGGLMKMYGRSRERKKKNGVLDKIVEAVNLVKDNGGGEAWAAHEKEIEKILGERGRAEVREAKRRLERQRLAERALEARQAERAAAKELMGA